MLKKIDNVSNIGQYSKKDFEHFFDQIGIKYAMNVADVSRLFNQTLEKLFDSPIISLEKNNNYGFYKYKDGDFKKISFSPRIRVKLKQNFEYALINSSINTKIDTVKKYLKMNHVFNGKIVKIDNDFFTVSTSFGMCKLPFTLIPSTEQSKMYIDSIHSMMIHSYKKNGLVLLTMKNSNIDLHVIKKLLKQYTVTKVNRYYGVRIKLYVDRKLSKIDFDSIKLFYSEKIQYVIVKKDSDEE